MESTQIHPNSRIARIQAVNMFEGLDEHQEYDPEVLSSLSSWANKVHVKTPKTMKAGRTQVSKDDTIIVRNNKDADAACNIIPAFPRDKK